MDYLNYGKKVQQKPKGFDEEVKNTKDDFSFGDLNQQTNTKDELIQLFPTPVLISSYPFDYSMELEWIKKQSFKRENKNQENGASLNRQTDDTFILDKPEMSRVRQFIDSKIKQFVVDIMGSDSELVITQSWVNKNAKGESHHEHKHPNSMVSGVWYPQIHEKLPPIQFRNSKQRDVTLSIVGNKYNHFNSATFMLPMKKGELIIFPSDSIHSVPTNHSDEERISLSFNTWCTGSMGNVEKLTYLPLEGKGLPVIK
tara:strand:+ start:194 stop:961 length:768 start_codon:yes stop_codon:yes gene_type:complete